MGLRVQRRIRLGKDFHLNLSKSGLSFSSKIGGVSHNSRGVDTIHIMKGVSYREYEHHAPHPAHPTAHPQAAVASEPPHAPAPLPSPSPTPPLASGQPEHVPTQALFQAPPPPMPEPEYRPATPEDIPPQFAQHPYIQASLNGETKQVNAVAYFILAFVLGEFGIHRFYRGQIGLGILYFFTAGLFGIGWLIDTIFALIWLCEAEPDNLVTFVHKRYVNG